MSHSGKGFQCGISENRLHHIVFLLVTVESTSVNKLFKIEKQWSSWNGACVLPPNTTVKNLINNSRNANLNIHK